MQSIHCDCCVSGHQWVEQHLDPMGTLIAARREKLLEVDDEVAAFSAMDAAALTPAEADTLREYLEYLNEHPEYV